MTSSHEEDHQWPSAPRTADQMTLTLNSLGHTSASRLENGKSRSDDVNRIMEILKSNPSEMNLERDQRAIEAVRKYVAGVRRRRRSVQSKEELN